MVEEATFQQSDVVQFKAGRQAEQLSPGQIRSMAEDMLGIIEVASAGFLALQREVEDTRGDARRAREDRRRGTEDRHSELRTLHKHLQGLRGRLQQQLHETQESRALAKAWQERAEAAQERISSLEQEVTELRQKAQNAMIRSWIAETRIKDAKRIQREA